MPTDTTSGLPNYVNRLAVGGSPSAPRWVDVRFQGLKPLQAAELNELQGILRRRLTSVGDALLKPGGIIDGAVPQITATASLTLNLKLNSGLIYFGGAVNVVPEQTLTIPSNAKVQVGIRYKLYEITPIDDSLLRNQQVGARNYQEDGAGRLVADWVWGWRADNATSDGFDNAVWAFYPIYDVNNGVIITKAPPSVSTGTVDLVARYDRESNGNYVAGGLTLQFIRAEAGNYIYSLAAGTANIDGYKIDILTDTRLSYPIDPNTTTVTGESHASVLDLDGKYQMSLNREPLAEITFLSCVKRKSVIMTHVSSGSSEELPDATVYSVISVVSGGTTYVATTDYLVVGDNISWSPAGAEPSPGASYTVTYLYTKVVIDTGSSITNDGTMEFQGPTFITLRGLENATPVNINYKYKLPRVDLISISRAPTDLDLADPAWRDDVIKRTVGVPQRRNPAPPAEADHQIAIAEVYLDWVGSPVVRNVSIRAVKMNDLVGMRRELNIAQDLIAQLELKTDRALRDPSIKKNTFVDPFTGEDQRDAGIAQTASINAGRLLRPITGSVVLPSDLGVRQSWWSLPYTLTPIIQQPYKTGFMKINPYQAFDRPPSSLVLTPNTDRWEETASVYTSEATRVWDIDARFHRNPQFGIWGSTVTDEVLGSSTDTAKYMRSRTISFTLSNFLSGEQLVSLLFDGVDLTPSPVLTANSSGVISGSIIIPSNIPVGTKTVLATGSAAPKPSRAEAAYVGQHFITTNQLQRITTLLKGRFDPLAQTFTLPEARQIAALDIKFHAKGSNSNNVFVQIREAELGFPNQEILGEAIIQASTITVDGTWTRATFPIPVALAAGREYAIVLLTDDALHSVAIAELGQRWDNGGGDVGYISEQPYTVGELLSSSNASTWTTHPTKDLAFKLQACAFTSTTRTINYGLVTFASTTDLVVKASVLRLDAATDVDWKITETTVPSPETYHLVEEQALQLTSARTGNATIEALLTGSATLSPIVYPDPQIALGQVATTADYYSEAFEVTNSFAATITFAVYKPGAASCTPTIQRQLMSAGSPVITGGVYQSEYVALVKTGVLRLADGWVEETYKTHPDVSDNIVGWTPPVMRGVGLDYTSRVKLVLSGTPQDRVYVKSLRAVIKAP